MKLTLVNLRTDQVSLLKQRDNASLVVRKAIEMYTNKDSESIGYQDVYQNTPVVGTNGKTKVFSLRMEDIYIDWFKRNDLNRSAVARHALDVLINCEYLGIVDPIKPVVNKSEPKKKRLKLSKDNTKCLISVMLSEAQKNWISIIQNGASEIRIALHYYIEAFYKNNPAFDGYLLEPEAETYEKDDLERFNFYVPLDVYHFVMSKGLDLSEITRDALDAFFMWQYETGDKKIPAAQVSEDVLKKHREFLTEACKGNFLPDDSPMSRIDDPIVGGE